jgi:SH3-like domain-containing protein
MNVARHISIAVALLLVLVTSSAAAEKVWTSSETDLRAEADRKSDRVARIQANRELTVIEKRGSWYRVKSGAKSGWIHRSDVRGGRDPERDRAARAPAPGRSPGNGTIDKAGSANAEPSPEPAALAAAGSGGSSGDPPADDPKVQKRPCREGSAWCDREGDAMRVVVVVSRVKAFREPQEDEDIAFLATQDQELMVIGYHRPNWMYVRTQDGKLGWIRKDAVRETGNLGRAREDSALTTPRTVDDGATRVSARPEEPPAPSLLQEEPASVRLRLGMSLGGALVGRAFVPDTLAQAGYDASSTALVTTLAGDLRFLLSGPWHLGLDGNFSMLAGLGGLTYDPATGDVIDVGNYVQHRTEAGLAIGYDVAEWGAYVRAGGLVEIFYVNDLLNSAALPRERLISPTVGLRLAVRPAAALELGLRSDVMLLGALAQTRGREDGDFETLFAVMAQADVAYALMERVALQAGLRLDRVSASWGGTSVRAAGVQGASRTDQTLRFVVGVQSRF